MLVALFTTFAASRKEPLVEMLERVHAAFIAAGFGEPTVRFSMSDPPATAEIDAVQAIMGTKRVSSIERVLKRWPELERFVRTAGAPARAASSRALSNVTGTDTIEPIDFALLKEIARGVPKSFPCHAVGFHFSAPGFSEGPALPAAPDMRTISMLMRAGIDIGAGAPTSAGIGIQDSWWVNGRQRSLTAMRIMEADPGAKNLPAAPEKVAAVFAACGKVRKTMQVPMMIGGAAPPLPAMASVSAMPPSAPRAESDVAMRAVVQANRAKLPELLEKLPHDIPQQVAPGTEAISPATGLPASGPKKPELVRAFGPLGYDCRGESGAFTLERRTSGNLTVRLRLDVGTWIDAIMAVLQVIGLKDGKGFKATLMLPVSPSAARGVVRGVELPAQFPIRTPERWRQIVENLAALVAELDRSFVPEIEAIAGPSPDWFRAEAAG